LHFYLTYNDTTSGIYSSQVIDVVKFFNTELKTNVKLVAFISIRSFFINRKKIKTEFSKAIVLPMFPGVHRWRNNHFLLSLFILIYKPQTIIGRSVFATQLALIAKRNGKIKNVVYDGRAAVKAEWEEYKVITNQVLLNSIFELEKQCVLQSDYRLAVSNALIAYWQNEFEYNSSQHAVIPCTINTLFEYVTIPQETISRKRMELGFNINDSVFVYSGSLAGWQSIKLMIDFIKHILYKSNTHKILFLSEVIPEIKLLQIEFPNQVQCIKLNPIDVPHFLIACDYGILIREKSVTNQVASPVKFAEYLACGLPVIISSKLGDYSEFVKLNECGFILTDFTTDNLKGLFLKEKIQKIALENFTKKNYIKFYKKLFCINTT
jgi:glycosyltransferase involved in cell wall biosynthesis